MTILARLKEMQEAHGKNRLVMVLDGMGVAVMNNLLDKNGFFCCNLTDVEQAIVPATTVAATTAYRTGKMPWQTGFVGWAQYFCETDEVIEVFLNTNYYTGEVSKMPQHTNRLPCKTVVEELKDRGRKAFEVMPSFMPDGYEKFDDWVEHVVELCNQETDAYIYAYWTNPDEVLHNCGSKSAEAKEVLCNMEQKIEKAFQNIHNKTDILVTADHGHIDIKYLFLEDYPEVEKCLLHPISLEGRCVSLFVKPECMAQFPEIFNRHFGKHFELIGKTEFEKKYLYADEPVRFIGDYVAMAIDEFEMKQNPDQSLMKSNHAGFTKDELEIPVIKISVS